NSIYIQEQRKFESKQQVALDILNAEIIGLDLNDYFNSSERIMNFSKDEIIETAKKYYGKNYLSFYSKQNLNPSKEKINKPNYDPVVPNAEAESNYATNFKSISSDNIKINLVDFNNAITKTNLKGAHTCYHTHNPKNDVFNLKIAYKVGSNEIEMLKYAGMVMDLAGTENISANRLRDTFNYLNCSFSFNVTDDRFYFSIQGLEQNIEQVIPIVGELLNQPTLQDKNLKTIVQGEKTNRKLEKTEADAIADALFEYMRFGKKSSYLDRLTMKELKKLETQTIIDAFKLSTQYEAAIHYSGKKEPSVIANLMAEFIPLNETPKRVNNEDFKHSKYHDKNTIYFVPKKNARQSKVYLVLNEFEYGPDKIAAINAFNLYFGGDFSGLVLQEIREYRSLAYTAGAWVTTPNYPTKPCGFVGFVGTQADKTNEAMDIYYELLTNMPQKPERTTLVKEYLINKLQNDQPSFRSLSSKIAWWQQMGYESDPRADLLKQYENLTFGDIVDFYNRHLQQNTISMAISGDPREIDLEALEQYGKVIELKSKDIVSK
ncbi:MAG: M16 family metallopeptidase, partial [Bacteroidia bacterium]